MKSSAKERLLSLAVVLGLAGVLITLGVLQYRWSREVSDATSTRMEASLQTSMMGVRQDLYRELASICLVFQSDPEAPADKDHKKYVQRYQEWARTAAHPDLVSNVFIWETGAGKSPRLLRLNGSEGEFEAAEWPANFQAVHDRLQATSLDMIVAALARLGLKQRPRGLNEPPPALERGRDNQRSASGPVFPWRIDQNIPLLVHANIQRNSSAEHAQPTVDWFLIELDSNVLQSHVMPELAERYFGGPEGLTYEVALVGGAAEPRVIYTSDRGFGTQDPRSTEAFINVFGPPHGPPQDSAAKTTTGLHADSGLGGLRMHDWRGPPAPVRVEPIRYSANDRDWQLLAKHRKGSLEAVVAATRRRNLTISFGVLLLLAASMAMVIITSLRAQRLAKLQMDFVAAVSHELRTPLAVISSAADNLADGVVESKPQLTQYGSVIKKQARQLTDLVEQILLFAAAREERPRFTLRPLQVSEIVDLAINHTAELIHAAQFTVEKDIPANLPAVMGDLPALSRCLQNLITNAVKYGGDQRWIGIRARASEDDGRSAEIQITVQDKGVGIATSDLPHIFEPFYRSPSVAAAQIHGTGLGLPLAKSIAEAMGGQLSVRSSPGAGSSFTLHLPLPKEVLADARTELGVAPHPKLS
ncbi:MAG TPA: HAMP domain-containing sensor histidine kinase [Terriglobales bacterium]|nr:HAMP domain-containing sensor histidine kinase [Terriglobales bacterium]